ncbi:MAG: SRPBCC domain-containing protein [Chloroflexota bacterium]
MKHFTATIDIDAPPSTVWQILTTGDQYTAWDPHMISLDGTIAPGEKLTVLTKLAPDRAFTPIVSEFDAPRKIFWSSKMPLGLFSGIRTFELEALEDNKTRFTHTEEFRGILMPVFGATIPDMNPVFADFTQALKSRAESH